MDGLTNQAIRDMIVVQHGEDVWTRVRQRAGVEAERFEAMVPYPDGRTMQLIDDVFEVRYDEPPASAP